MPRFLAVYTMRPEDLASFRNLPKAEQDEVDAVGIKEWSAWEERNASSILDPGGMVGKTTRMTKEGVVNAVNSFCGYLRSKRRALMPLRDCSKTTRTSPFFRATGWI